MSPDASIRRRGFALPLVLWLIGVLMAMVMGVAYSAKLGHIESRTRFDRVEAEAAARAGIALAVARTDPRLGDAAWSPSPSTRQLALDDWQIRLTLRDEAGKFDLNHGDLALLPALLQALRVPPAQGAALLAALEARRGQDIRAPASPFGPSLPAPASRAITGVSELRQWPGLAPDTLARIAPELTVHGQASLPDWRAASPAMRQALAASGHAGVDDAGGSGPASGSGTYAIESVARRPGKPPGRVFAVLRVTPRTHGGMDSVWLAWGHGSWGQ